VRAPVLTTSISNHSNRLVYFDRWENAWHFDISDHLATYGATYPLTLEELCSLCGVDNRTPTTAVTSQRAALAIFELFGRLAALSGRLCSADEHRLTEDICDARSDMESPCG
jgi:hypothetical protein